MELPQVGTVGFVVVLVAFFTAQFNLKGNIALAAAFVVALLFNIAPLLSSPLNAPAIVDVILNTVLLTISASGGYNFINKVATKVSGLKAN